MSYKVDEEFRSARSPGSTGSSAPTRPKIRVDCDATMIPTELRLRRRSLSIPRPRTVSNRWKSRIMTSLLLLIALFCSAVALLSETSKFLPPTRRSSLTIPSAKRKAEPYLFQWKPIFQKRKPSPTSGNHTLVHGNETAHHVDTSVSTVSTEHSFSVPNNGSVSVSKAPFSLYNHDPPPKRPQNNLTTSIHKSKPPKEIDKKSDELITMKDLDTILSSRGYVREADLDSSLRTRKGKRHVMVESVQTGEKKTAFPQERPLTQDDIKLGSTAVASVFGMFLGLSILPNLWLMGALLGGTYGNSLPEKEDSLGVISATIVNLGRAVARRSIRLKFMLDQFWFSKC